MIPTVLLFSRRVRGNPTSLYFMSLLVLFGFIANRLNVSITGMEAGSGVHYIPRWTKWLSLWRSAPLDSRCFGGRF